MQIRSAAKAHHVGFGVRIVAWVPSIGPKVIVVGGFSLSKMSQTPAKTCAWPFPNYDALPSMQSLTIQDLVSSCMCLFGHMIVSTLVVRSCHTVACAVNDMQGNVSSQFVSFDLEWPD
jgi:hypothetical protein